MRGARFPHHPHPPPHLLLHTHPHHLQHPYASVPLRRWLGRSFMRGARLERVQVSTLFTICSCEPNDDDDDDDDDYANF